MPDPMQICGACGVVRVQRAASCPRCAAAYEAATLTVPFRAMDTYWVCIECTFKCRACGFRVPLNHLDMDGAVLCARCGLEQAFNVSQWRSALDHAQGTGDLWNEQKVYRERDLVVLGDSSCSRERSEPGENDFGIVASPGQPLCEACHQPFAVALDEESLRSGRTTATCACGETASYEVPGVAQHIAPAIKGIVATEHRTDRKAVKVDQNAAAIAVACPLCNAPLEVNESSKFLTCTFCHATSRIPDRTWFRISGKDPRPDPMWLLFRGPSKEREDIEAKRLQDEREAERRARRDTEISDETVRQANERTQERQREKDAEQRKEQLTAEMAEERAQRAREDAADRRRGFIVIAVIAVPVVGVAIYFASRGKPARTDPLSIAEAACDTGDGKACDRAGELLSQGNYPALQRSRYESACNAKYAPGCTHRGRVSENLKEYTKAATFYDRGCQGGDTPGCTARDALYASGNAVSSDPSTASLFYDKACTAGKVESCVSGGLAYTDGNGVAKDAPRAAGLLTKACDAGSARGCNLLGHAYEAASGVPKDDKEMLRLYQKACDKQTVYCFDLGRLYETGRGVTKNEPKALSLYAQACSNGSTAACAAVRK